MKLNTIPELIADIKAGKFVVLMDDEDRENEGDLVMAAERVTPEHINFMARFARGLICMPMSQSHCEQLNLPLMVNQNKSRYGTNFTLSIEAAEGVSSGISAADRALTVQVAAKPDASPRELVNPGHIFPIMAREGGVLTRAGHTEGSCDLAVLAGYGPTAVLAEIMNDDGTMARRPELEVFAKQHQLKIGTIADLIKFRLHHEKTIEKVNVSPVETRYGTFELVRYKDKITSVVHQALCYGDYQKVSSTLVRVHVRDDILDLPGMAPTTGRWTLEAAMKKIAQEGHGVIVVLSSGDETSLTPAAGEQPIPDWWSIGTGSQILSDLGLSKLRVLSAPKKLHALSGFGLEIEEYLAYEE